MLGKYWVPSREGLINHLQWEFLDASMYKGYDIVIDNMNLDEKYVKEIEKLVKDLEDLNYEFQYEIEIKDFFHIPLQVCIERDAQRENPIGEKIIKRTYYKYKDKIPAWKYLK